MVLHRGNERAREIDAHLPREARGLVRARREQRTTRSERCVRDGRELARLTAVAHLAREARDLIEAARPLRKVMKVLAFSVPLEALVEGLAGRPLRQRLADAQPAARRMKRALVIIESTQPAATRVIGPVPPEHRVHLIDEVERELAVMRVAGAPGEREEIADGEGVRPEVAARWLARREPRARREAQPQLGGEVQRVRRGGTARAQGRHGLDVRARTRVTSSGRTRILRADVRDAGVRARAAAISSSISGADGGMNGRNARWPRHARQSRNAAPGSREILKKSDHSESSRGGCDASDVASPSASRATLGAVDGPASSARSRARRSAIRCS